MLYFDEFDNFIITYMYDDIILLGYLNVCNFLQVICICLTLFYYNHLLNVINLCPHGGFTLYISINLYTFL